MDEQTLNDLLECSVCLERLDTTSKVLPCQHTFCRKCLEDIVSSKHELRCPECRILVKMRVEDLPPNVLLMRILGGLKQDLPTKENATVAAAKLTSQPPPPTPKPDDTNSPKPRNPDPGTITPSPPAQQILSRPVLGAPLPHKYLPQNVCHAKALFDFQSNISGDLAFKKGDVIVLRRRVDQNWFYGHLNGREGAFPVNHVQIIVPLPVPQCRAVFDFRMGPNEEEGCLSFAKGQIITVLRRIDQNWAEGRIGECIGIFPINFVELNSLAKQLMGGDKDTGRASLGEAMTTAGQAPQATTPTSPEVTATQRLPPMPTKVVDGGGQSNYPGVVRRAPPHALNLLSNNNSSSSAAAALRRHSAEILDAITSSELNRKSTPNSSSAGGLDTPRLLPYVAVFSYKPQKLDELELVKGAQYYVSERCQDGWLRGMDSARKAGVFPGNHVIPLKEMPVAPVAQGVSLTTGFTQELSNANNPRASASPSTPTSPPILPPRNQASTDQPGTVVVANEAKRDSINLIKRITNNLKRSKSPSEETNGGGPSAATTTTTPRAVGAPQPRLLQSIHSRSGSCPSQLLDLSALKITAINQPRPNVPQSAGDQQPAMSYGSQRVRGQKERPALHSIHRQLGERKEDLTALGQQRMSAVHKKSNSLDAGRIISSVANGTDGQHGHGTRNTASRNSGSSSSGGGGAGGHQQVKEKFRCIVAYPPNSEYELGLNVGDIVLVNKKRENGWYRGVHQRSGKSGLFPASFVEPAA